MAKTLKTNSFDQKTVPMPEIISTASQEPPKLLYREDEKLKPKKTIRIAVSGDVHITQIEQKIIDTTEFQRLRGVRQLGSVLYVYPTALHTRFDHSLGTLAFADEMLNSIKFNKHSEADEKKIDADQEILIRLYALLHDITHIPYGHTIEDELMLIPRHDENPKRILRFLGPGSAIGDIIINGFSKSLYDRFMAIFIWKDGITWDQRMKEIHDESIKDEWKKLEQWNQLNGDDTFINDIVSNTVCADLLDYLKRDNFFCNLGDSMEYRFLNYLYIGKMDFDGGSLRRVFVRLWKKGKKVRRDTLTDLARLLEARYLLAERVYFHHAKIVAGAMLGRAIQEAIIAGQLKEDDLYFHTDDTLIRELSKIGLNLSETLANALLKRDFYGIFKAYSLEDFAALQSHDQTESQLNFMKSLTDPRNRRELEDEIACCIGGNPGDVLIYAPPKSMNMKVAHTKVIWNGLPINLKDIDDKVINPRLKQILDAHEMLWEIKIICKKTLTNNQKKLLDSSCLYHFGTQFDKKNEQYHSLMTEVIENELVCRGACIVDNVAGYKETLALAAQDLMLAATDKTQDFKDRIHKVIDKYFSPKL